MNQKQLVEAARRLIALVDDPQPGLATWNAACGVEAARIKASFDERSPDGSIYVTCQTDGQILMTLGIHGETPAVEVSMSPEKALLIANVIRHQVSLCKRRGS